MFCYDRGMSRPIRIEIEDGWYHVISRGIERRAILRDDSDRSDFLGSSILGRVSTSDIPREMRAQP